MKNFSGDLSQKDATAFKQLIKLYEQKQYKKGLKSADKLLESIPNHAETLSMKSIFLYLSGSVEEGAKLAKEALMKNVKSEICWHIYGIINRIQRNYSEAAKCYQQALKYAPTNLEILRDLAILQIQIRDLDGYCDTRLKLLQNKEGMFVNWIGYAVANHLKGDYQQAIKVLTSFNKLLHDNPLKPYEKSELILYQGLLLQEAQQYQESIKLLSENKNEIVDQSAFLEMQVKNYIASKQQQQAVETSKQLLDLCPDSKKHWEYLREASQVDPQNQEQLAAFYEDLTKKYPQSESLKSYQLTIVKDEMFKQKFTSFIQRYFRKGIPSVFNEIKPLYADEPKVKIIDEILKSNLVTLEKNQTFLNSPDEEETPSCLLWNYMVLAQHLDRIGQYSGAIEMINKAIEHTPTLIELYLVKAKIQKHLYNFGEAFKLADQARQLDLADRYLNNFTIKYALRHNLNETAELLIRLFLRDPTDGSAYDLQTMWYELRMGEAYQRRKMYGACMRMFKFIETQFNDMYEDQFDYHVYCLRKYQMRSYIQMINSLNNQRDDKNFIRAASHMIEELMQYTAYKKQENDRLEKEKEEFAKLSATERKKLNRKKQKEESKIQQQESQQLDIFAEYRKKYDLEGKQLLEKLQDPYQEAMKFASQLINVKISNPKLGLLAYKTLIDFYISQDRELLCLRALIKLVLNKYDPIESQVYITKALVYLTESLKKEKLQEPLKGIVSSELAQIMGASSTPENLNSQFFDKQPKDSADVRFAQLRIDAILGKLTVQQLGDELEKLLLSGPVQKISQFITIATFREADCHLEVNQKIKEQFVKQFPLSNYYVLEKADQPQSNNTKPN